MFRANERTSERMSNFAFSNSCAFTCNVLTSSTADIDEEELKATACGKKEKEEESVTFFRGGNALIDLEVNTLFDEDSIVANVLTVSRGHALSD